ncbi:hypothetical protein TWF192_000268 [Orbilia oligospora]|uniref:Uncharacterized protein n=1 Tax=Orbilia oligospora TaxID=2813651 RepID=A0A6G1MQ19_ORBOL|nr:hypothetical protein TWF191_010384 [Orbilia oligospora]KAF3265623.1 hypothetical protein TWF192_000268 [Orbilia oligospora]
MASVKPIVPPPSPSIHHARDTRYLFARNISATYAPKLVQKLIYDDYQGIRSSYYHCGSHPFAAKPTKRRGCKVDPAVEFYVHRRIEEGASMAAHYTGYAGSPTTWQFKLSDPTHSHVLSSTPITTWLPVDAFPRRKPHGHPGTEA